jgi:hypothetical protein
LGHGKRSLSRREFMGTTAAIAAGVAAKDTIASSIKEKARKVYLVPRNEAFGWLTTFSWVAAILEYENVV